MSERYLILIMPGVGLLLLLIGAFVLYRVRRFVKESLRTTGTVVGFDERRGGKGGRTYAPVVTFEVRDRGAFRFTDPLHTSPKGYDVGQQVEVLYHWQDHSRARLASPFRLYFVPGLLGFLGLVFTSVGAIIFWFT
ncbi:MAG TPA: DUF3592 domain-containing protein [Pyrinomonadaceae bacterium]|jgi:hypothetical protein